MNYPLLQTAIQNKNNIWKRVVLTPWSWVRLQPSRPINTGHDLTMWGKTRLNEHFHALTMDVVIHVICIFCAIMEWFIKLRRWAEFTSQACVRQRFRCVCKTFHAQLLRQKRSRYIKSDNQRLLIYHSKIRMSSYSNSICGPMSATSLDSLRSLFRVLAWLLLRHELCPSPYMFYIWLETFSSLWDFIWITRWDKRLFVFRMCSWWCTWL